MKKILLLSIISMMFVLSFSVVFAQLKDTEGTLKESTSTAPSTTSLTNPLGTTDVPTLVKNVINAALAIVGSLALLMFVYGGFMWMLSAGNEKMVTNGKNTLMWASLGLVVIFMSYALVNFIITNVTKG